MTTLKMTTITGAEFQKMWEAAGKTYYPLTPVGTTWGSTTATPPTSGASSSEHNTSIKQLQESLGMKNLDPKTKTDAEWEEAARNNAGDAEVSALIRLLDIERAKVLQYELATSISNSVKDLISETPQPNDWTAFSHDPKAPVIPYE